MGAFIHDIHRLLWFSVLTTTILVACLTISVTDADSKVDTDLVFDSLEETNSKENNNHLRISRSLSESGEQIIIKSSPPVEESWFSSTVGRIKRSISNLFSNQDEEIKHQHKRIERSTKKKRQLWLFGGQEEDDDDENGQQQEEDEDDETNEIDNNSTGNYQLGFFDISDDDDSGPSGYESGDGKNEIDEHPVYFRTTITVMLPYEAEYSDRNSQKFRTFAEQFATGIERLYDNVPGTQTVSIVRIQKREADSFTSKVTADIVSVGYSDSTRIRDILYNHIQSTRRIGTHYAVAPEDFHFRAFDAPQQEIQCEPNELRCTNGQCVPSIARCDGRYDCSDYSDEIGCNQTKPPSNARDVHPTTIEPRIVTSGEDTIDEGSGEGIYHECRADDVVRCPDGSRLICADQNCDGKEDCNDGSDERNCSKECAVDEFGCDISRCYPLTKRCDGFADCEDGTDEHECPICDGFTCNDRTCISLNKHCDGIPDCLDQSDEYDCPSPGAQCGPGRFSCGNHECVWNSQLCDGVPDCSNGLDELNCTRPTVRCTTEEFACDNGKCIPKAAKCDRKYDCEDRSDERRCPCKEDDFHCKNGFCIPPSQRCDGIHNCQDGSDEIGCSNQTSMHFASEYFTTHFASSLTVTVVVCNHNHTKYIII